MECHKNNIQCRHDNTDKASSLVGKENFTVYVRSQKGYEGKQPKSLADIGINIATNKKCHKTCPDLPRYPYAREKDPYQ
jgi:hypothetical protein